MILVSKSLSSGLLVTCSNFSNVMLQFGQATGNFALRDLAWQLLHMGLVTCTKKMRIRHADVTKKSLNNQPLQAPLICLYNYRYGLVQLKQSSLTIRTANFSFYSNIQTLCVSCSESMTKGLSCFRFKPFVFVWVQ
jgi:hypothetical protein